MESRRGLIWATGAALATGAVLVAALVVVMIVQGDDSDNPFADIPVAEGRVTCEAFRQAHSYRYKTSVTYDLQARQPGMDDSDGYGPDPFLYTQHVEGAYADGEYDVTTTSEPTSEEVAPGRIIVAGDNFYVFVTSEWIGKPLSESSTFPISYLPSDTCSSLAPDVYLDQAIGVPESVSGVAATRYHYDSLMSDWTSVHPNFGPGSDASKLIDTYSGDIWVADEGGYIIKVDLAGLGTHPNGRELRIRMSYELWDVNDESISIEPPRPSG